MDAILRLFLKLIVSEIKKKEERVCVCVFVLCMIVFCFLHKHTANTATWNNVPTALKTNITAVCSWGSSEYSFGGSNGAKKNFTMLTSLIKPQQKMMLVLMASTSGSWSCQYASHRSPNLTSAPTLFVKYDAPPTPPPTPFPTPGKRKVFVYFVFVFLFVIVCVCDCI